MNKQVFIINGSGCVDCDTEFFNGYQWKPISKYIEGEKVLQYNKDGSAELVYPLSFIKEKQDKFNLYKNKNLNMCISDDHTCCYITSKGNLHQKSFNEIKKDFNNSKYGFNGKFITSFNYKTDNTFHLSDSEIKLMIAIIADGHFKNNNSNLCYLNLKKERKKEEFRRVCEEANIEYKEKQYPSMPNYSRFFVKAPLHEKNFSSHWYNCSQKQLRLIAENVVKWDGNNLNRFFTNNKESADFIQFVFSSLGYNATITQQDRIGIKHYKTKEYSVTKSSINLHTMNKDERNKQKNEINEYISKDGFQYCFTVPSGMWVMRRKDKICVTGNCVGKDTFVELVSKVFNLSVMNFSSVDKVKEIARIIGWTGGKTEKDRKFLSDLKLLCTDYNNMPFNSMSEKVKEFTESDAAMLFLHIREPEEIEKAKVAFGAKTVLIKRDAVKQITSNMADGNVFNYQYDIVVDNDGDLAGFESKAAEFVKDFNLNNMKSSY